MLTAEVVHPRSEKRCQMNFYAAATHDRTILGIEACKAMDQISIDTQNICAMKEMRTSPTRAQSWPPPLMKDFIIERYADLFDGVGLRDGEVHLEVDRTVPPVKMTPHRLLVAIKESVKAELDEMCRNGIIEPVSEASPWVSALLVVTKPNSRLRICLYPRPLNKALKRSVYAMPTIDDILPQLVKAKAFIVDATQGFTHVKLDKESSALTKFETPFSRYRWLRLPFGTSPSPEISKLKCTRH